MSEQSSDQSGVQSTEPISPLTKALSEYIAGTADRALPPAVAEKTRHHVLDTIAAIVSGSRLRAGRLATGYVSRLAGVPEALVIGTSFLVPAEFAALANAMSGHADETDDSHLGGRFHPGCGIVPAALAVAELKECSGAQFVRAVALGYDIGARLNMSMGYSEPNNRPGHSTHSLGTAFGAAAAAAALLRFDARQVRHVLSYAGQQASGIGYWTRDAEHIEKSFDFGGMPARNGITAALLVQAGGTALDDIFSGADNFLEAFKPMNDPSMLIEALGERYEIMRTDVKKWTVGAPIQAPLDAMANLMQKNRFTADQVQKVAVRVATDEATIVDNREIPDISLQHLMAVMLVDKTVSFKTAHDEARMKDPAVLKERAKVQLVRDGELEKQMPKRVAVVELTMADGKMLSERVETVRGTAGNPMTREEMIAKARDLIVPVLGADKFQKLSDKIFALESVKNVAELRPLLQTA